MKCPRCKATMVKELHYRCTYCGYFHPLSKEEIQEIRELCYKNIYKELKEKRENNAKRN